MVFYGQYRIPHRRGWIDLRLLTDANLPDLLGSLLRLLLDLPPELLHLRCERGHGIGHITLGFLTERDSRHRCLCIKAIHLVKEIHLPPTPCCSPAFTALRISSLVFFISGRVIHEPTVLHVERGEVVDLELRCIFPM